MVCATSMAFAEMNEGKHDFTTETEGFYAQEARYKKVDENAIYTKFLVWVVGYNNNHNQMETAGCFGALGVLYVSKADKRDSLFFLVEALGDCTQAMKEEWLPNALNVFEEDRIVEVHGYKSDNTDYNSAELFTWFDEFEIPEIPNLESASEFQSWKSTLEQMR